MPSEREVEAAARAMVVSDEQNGGPPWEYIMGLGKHAVEPLYDRARAALSAAEGVRKEEGRDYDALLTCWAESRERHLAAEASVASLRDLLGEAGEGLSETMDLVRNPRVTHNPPLASEMDM